MGQIFFCYSHRSLPYRISLIVHHIFSASCACCIYYVDPYISYIYSINACMEFSNIFLSIRYFGRAWNNKSLYFMGGIGTLIFYPLTRLSITVYCSYLAYYGLFYLFIGRSGFCWSYWQIHLYFCCLFIIVF